MQSLLNKLCDYVAVDCQALLHVWVSLTHQLRVLWWFMALASPDKTSSELEHWITTQLMLVNK